MSYSMVLNIWSLWFIVPTVGSWIKNIDYYRLDGCVSATNRRKWADLFNNPANSRYRSIPPWVLRLLYWNNEAECFECVMTKSLLWFCQSPCQRATVSHLNESWLSRHQPRGCQQGHHLWRLVESVLRHTEHIQGVPLRAAETSVCVSLPGSGELTGLWMKT